MEFSTPILLSTYATQGSHSKKMVLLGSCFAENIGKKLEEYKFLSETNPFGTLYNPLSVASAIQSLLDRKQYEAADLFKHEGCFHSFDHHSRFSSIDKGQCLNQINSKVHKACEHLKESSFLFITFGSAYVYRLKENNRIVANCHKLPDKLFKRELLSVETIVSTWTNLINKITKVNSNLHIIFTISPIRHLKDGAHGNQVSKATLLLAVEQLQGLFPEQTSYFPAYEIMLDELRDYRFYAEDMVHPSPLAIHYIWERFASSFMTSDTRKIMKEWDEIQKAMNHKPFQPDSEAYKKFIVQTLLKIEHITKKIPSFDTQNEIRALKSKLK